MARSGGLRKSKETLLENLAARGVSITPQMRNGSLSYLKKCFNEALREEETRVSLGKGAASRRNAKALKEGYDPFLSILLTKEEIDAARQRVLTLLGRRDAAEAVRFRFHRTAKGRGFVHEGEEHSLLMSSVAVSRILMAIRDGRLPLEGNLNGKKKAVSLFIKKGYAFEAVYDIAMAVEGGDPWIELFLTNTAVPSYRRRQQYLLLYAPVQEDWEANAFGESRFTNDSVAKAG